METARWPWPLRFVGHLGLPRGYPEPLRLGFASVSSQTMLGYPLGFHSKYRQPRLLPKKISMEKNTNICSGSDSSSKPGAAGGAHI